MSRERIQVRYCAQGMNARKRSRRYLDPKSRKLHGSSSSFAATIFLLTLPDSVDHDGMLTSMRAGMGAVRVPAASVSRRALQHFAPTYAKVTPPNPFALSQILGNDARHRAAGSSSSTMDAAEEEVKDHRAILQLKRERKLKEYEAKVRMKAAQQGLSVEELKQQALKKPAFLVQKSASTDAYSEAEGVPPALSNVEKEDQRIRETIQQRSKAEAARKLATGQLQSTPHGSQEGPIKPLSKILDVEKIHDQDAATVTKLWTGYHMIKNKLSGVIPKAQYAQMMANARQFPQFVLPLPRKVIDETMETMGESKEAFEMNFLEWAILPNSTHSGLPPSTTVFTPLAEYKLKQDFSQPVLILTHYTDLAESHGIVLMRGEITNLNEKTGKGGRIDQKEAQLLSLTLQRFYLPTPNDDGKACAQLLETFHRNPEQFDVEKLVDTAFQFKL